METLPLLIPDLGLILVAAGLITLLFEKLRQPIVLGYIVAGFIVSPHMPYTQSVLDESNIEVLGNIGVIFLLFSLGLEFSFKKITKMGAAPVIAAILIVFFMMLLGNCIGHAFGWSHMDCIFLGGMLAMSSTTIIYKAFDDMGFAQQKFTSIVMSVLILEDILAIVLMVMLSAIAQGDGLDGQTMLLSITKIVFYILVWFVLGIFLIPLFLRKTRKLMNDETLLIIALALCFSMAVFATKVGFSSAFGAFIMGSILAETLEVEKIEKVVAPVKNLFGAVFFVSVGMLVDINIIVEYALPIICLVLTILIGHVIFSSLSYFISGQTLKNAMKCGFSMTQIGEFAFIIASLGLSMNVISSYLYPVVVAVSVITTFLTPYMINAAEPAYGLFNRYLPSRWMDKLNSLTLGNSENQTGKKTVLNTFVSKSLSQTLLYAVICAAILLFMMTLGEPFLQSFMPEYIAQAIATIFTILLVIPFVYAMLKKEICQQERRNLWSQGWPKRVVVLFMYIIRIFLAFLVFDDIMYVICPFVGAPVRIGISVALLIAVCLTTSIGGIYKAIENIFLKNLHAREVQQAAKEKANANKAQQFKNERLISSDIHIATFTMPENSEWSGQSLHNLHFGSHFGVHISSIIRGSYHINIPRGSTCLYPGDILHVIGNDEQLTNFAKAIKTRLLPDGIKQPDMDLLPIVLSDKCPFVGKTIVESGIRNKYKCMALGLDEGLDDLIPIHNDLVFEAGDILWLVGEPESLKRIAQDNKGMNAEMA